MHERNPVVSDRPSSSPGAGGSPAAARGALLGQAALALVGAYVAYTSLGLGLWSDLGPGPGFIPLVLGGALILLALSWFVQERSQAARAARTAIPASTAPAQGAAETAPANTAATNTVVADAAGADPAETGPAAETGAPAAGAGRGHVLAILGSLVVLGLTIDLLGFQLSMFAFLLFHLLRTGDVRWWIAVIIALVGSVGTFVLFGAGLGVQLPAAGIPFLANLGL